MLQVCAREGIGYTPFSPLAGGWLTGKYRRGEEPPAGSRMTLRPEPYEHLRAERTFDALEAFAEHARQRGTSAAALALAWVHDRGQQLGARVASIPGTPSVAHLHANLEAFAVELTDEIRAEIDTYADQVSGPRAADPNWVSGGREGLI